MLTKLVDAIVAKKSYPIANCIGLHDPLTNEMIRQFSRSYQVNIERFNVDTLCIFLLISYLNKPIVFKFKIELVPPCIRQMTIIWHDYHA